MRQTNKALLLTTGSLLLALGGCVKATHDGAQTTFTYSLWVPLSFFAGCLLGAAIGWSLRRKSDTFGWGLLCVSVLFGIFGPASLWRDRVVLNAGGFEIRTGIWGLTAVHEVSFAGLTEIHVVVRKSDNAGRGNDYSLRCVYSKSIRDEVPFNNKLVRFAAPRILNAAKEQGIRVVGEGIPWDAVR